MSFARLPAALFVLVCLIPQLFAADKPAYSVLAADKGRVALVSSNGKVEWEVPTKAEVHDLALLPNGNLLYPTGPTTIVEITRTGKAVWKYQAKPKPGYSGRIEIHAFQRLGDGNTMVAESGNARIVEVDQGGKVVKVVPLKIEKPNPHRDTRMARKLANGHYLVCHEADGKVREYDSKGKVVWTYKLDLGGRPPSDGHGLEGHGTSVFMRLAPSQRQYTHRLRQWQPGDRGYARGQNRLGTQAR